MDPFVPPKNIPQNPPAAPPAPGEPSPMTSKPLASSRVSIPQGGQIDWSYRSGSSAPDTRPTGPLTLEEAVKSQLGSVVLKPVPAPVAGADAILAQAKKNVDVKKVSEKIEQIHTLQGDMKYAQKSDPSSSAAIISSLEGLGPVVKVQTKFTVPSAPKVTLPKVAPIPPATPIPKPPEAPIVEQIKTAPEQPIRPRETQEPTVPGPSQILPRPVQTRTFAQKSETENIIKKIPPLKSLEEVEDMPRVKWAAPTIQPSEHPKLPTEPVTQKKISPIQTFTSDISEAVKSQGTSIASIAIAESERRKNTPSQASTGIITAVIVIISIVLIGGGGGLLVYLLTPTTVIPKTQQSPVPLIIRADSKKEIILDQNSRDGFASLLKTEVNRGVPYSTIEEIVVTKVQTIETGTIKRPATSLEFFSFIDANLSPALERAFAPGLMLGIHTIEGTHPFMIVRLSSYDNAYAGMLKWERTMSTDLSDIFDFTRGVVEVNNGAFVDGVIKNIDVRFLKNTDGSVKLLYGFVDNKTLVITDSDLTLTTISERLRTASLVK